MRHPQNQIGSPHLYATTVALLDLKGSEHQKASQPAQKRTTASVTFVSKAPACTYRIRWPNLSIQGRHLCCVSTATLCGTSTCGHAVQTIVSQKASLAWLHLSEFA